MDETRISALEEQVSQLRKSNRRMRGLGALAVVLGGAALLTGGKPDKNVEYDTVVATTFGVKGKKDKYRAILGVDDKGTFPQLQLLDNKERVRFMVGLEKDGSATITFYDKDGKETKSITGDSK